jgi:CheY-like chemotaxis protein
VRADPLRVEQVIGNLIVNAAKFTPDGGVIDVESLREGNDALMRITDNGCGIEPAQLDSVFELFRQESPSVARTEGGLGIGLTLVRHLMELHGGAVRAVSEGLGRGSCFEVRLPLDPSESELQAMAHGPATMPAPSRRVLIVEDGADARDSLGMLMEAWNHRVLYATSGPEGLSLARTERPDVAVVDIGLPGFDGYRVAQAIRDEGSDWARNVRLIALTGYGQPADRARALDSGFDVHVLKPVDPEELQALLCA